MTRESRRRYFRSVGWALAGIVCFFAAVSLCHGEEPSKKEAGPRKLTTQSLPNAWRIHPKVISGGLPEGGAAFRELSEQGVRTIISVDGAKPDVELAKKYGMRYVHLPHGYDGISDARARELAKAVRDLPGPIYLHCHHGKHRSPTAAAVACVGAGLIAPNAAAGILEAAGTNPNYRGLYQSARHATRFETELLDALEVEFPERARIPPLAQAMVALEHTHDRLKLSAAENWMAPKQYPDLDPAHEALLLREHFAEMLRTDDVRRQPAAFQEMMRESETESRRLEDSLRAFLKQRRQAGAAGAARNPPELLTTSFQRVTNTCKACHIQFRDVPLGEK